jgi:hypothetical protein
MTKTERKRLAKVYRDAADVVADFALDNLSADDAETTLNFFAAMVEAGDA